VNSATALSIVTGTLGATFAVACAFIARDPRWRELKWFALLAATGAIFGLTNSLSTTIVHPQTTPWIDRFNLIAAGSHAIFWIPYLAAQEGRRLNSGERVLVCLCSVLLALTIVPGLVLSDRLATHSIPSLGLSYVYADPTPFGKVLYGAYWMVLVFPLVRLLQRSRRGDPNARTQVFALALLLVAAANDSFAMVADLPMPFLLDFGFLAVIATMGGGVVKQFVEASRSYELLSAQLETIVAARTQALAQVERALQQSEKLAAIGQFAAGVAHEINSPAAAIRSNLQYLCEESLEEGRLPADGAECLHESLSSINRIVDTVQQLLAAGGISGTRSAPGRPFPVLASVSRALADGRLAAKQGVELILDVSEDLHAFGSVPLFDKVVLNLLLNAWQSIAAAGRPGRIEVRADRLAQRVRLKVTDNGVGISPKIQGRLFEPFMTTKKPGQGAGLGLAVSLALMRAQGGDLSLLSSDASGTTFVADLPWTAGPTPEERPDARDSQSGRAGSPGVPTRSS
jgi:signal transduction histidine kinase